MLSLLALLTSVQADDPSHYQPVGRYTQISLAPALDQTDLLAAVLDAKFPASVRTVGQAIQYLLSNAGYRMASLLSADPALPTLLNSPLPGVHRHIGPISLREGLLVLSTDAWVLVEDPVNRLISFELADRFKE